MTISKTYVNIMQVNFAVRAHPQKLQNFSFAKTFLYDATISSSNNWQLLALHKRYYYDSLLMVQELHKH